MYKEHLAVQEDVEQSEKEFKRDALGRIIQVPVMLRTQEEGEEEEWSAFQWEYAEDGLSPDELSFIYKETEKSERQEILTRYKEYLAAEAQIAELRKQVDEKRTGVQDMD